MVAELIRDSCRKSSDVVGSGSIVFLVVGEMLKVVVGELVIASGSSV